jgi:hypothetical protein
MKSFDIVIIVIRKKRIANVRGNTGIISVDRDEH